MLNIKSRNDFHFKSLNYASYAYIRNKHKLVTLVIVKLKSASFSFLAPYPSQQTKNTLQIVVSIEHQLYEYIKTIVIGQSFTLATYMLLKIARTVDDLN